MPAKTIDSYKDTLYAVMDTFNPKTVLEYGPGQSTMMISMHPSVSSITSIEHDKYWYEKMLTNRIDKLVLVLEEDLDKYPYARGGGYTDHYYDLIFIDGRNRSACLEFAMKWSSLIILHDADRGKYQPAIDKYKFKKWTDDGNTVVLTNSEDVYSKIKDLAL